MLARIIIESILVFVCALIGAGCAIAGFATPVPIVRIIFGAVGLVNTAAAMMLAVEVRGWMEMRRAHRLIEQMQQERLRDAIARAEECMERVLQEARQRAEVDAAVRRLLRDLEG